MESHYGLSRAGVQGRLFLDTPGACATNPTVLAGELAASSLKAADPETVIGMRIWPASVALEIVDYGNLDIRSLEMALTSNGLPGLQAPQGGNASILLQVRSSRSACGPCMFESCAVLACPRQRCRQVPPRSSRRTSLSTILLSTEIANLRGHGMHGIARIWHAQPMCHGNCMHLTACQEQKCGTCLLLPAGHISRA